MLWDILHAHTPGFFGPRFSRSVLRAIFHLALVVALGEALRLHSFASTHRDRLAALHLTNVVQQTLDAIPADLTIDISSARPGRPYPELTVNRELPFRLPLPGWCSSALTLLISYMARADDPAELLESVLPEPVVLFTRESDLPELDGLEEIVVRAGAGWAEASREGAVGPWVWPCPVGGADTCPRPLPLPPAHALARSRSCPLTYATHTPASCALHASTSLSRTSNFTSSASHTCGIFSSRGSPRPSARDPRAAIAAPRRTWSAF